MVSFDSATDIVTIVALRISKRYDMKSINVYASKVTARMREKNKCKKVEAFLKREKGYDKIFYCQIMK